MRARACLDNGFRKFNKHANATNFRRFKTIRVSHRIISNTNWSERRDDHRERTKDGGRLWSQVELFKRMPILKGKVIIDRENEIHPLLIKKKFSSNNWWWAKVLNFLWFEHFLMKFNWLAKTSNASLIIKLVTVYERGYKGDQCVGLRERYCFYVIHTLRCHLQDEEETSWRLMGGCVLLECSRDQGTGFIIKHFYPLWVNILNQSLKIADPAIYK